jgi:ferrochelatase
VAFQSRFGKAEWLKPYTSEVITELGKKQIGQLDVFCPGFVADCLETLEEIAMEGQHDFVSAGGKKYSFIPCLNDNPLWISTLVTLVKTELTGWLTNGKADGRDNLQLNQTLEKSKALGAVN